MIEFEKGYVDLDKIYDSGQVFRWKKIDDKEYQIYCLKHTNDRNFTIKQKENKIFCDSSLPYNEQWIAGYFDINTDYSKFHDELAANNANEYLREAAEFSKGIRILRQSLWETIVSFIISQNSNIPKIKKSVQSLCDKYGHFPLPREIIKREMIAGDSVKDCGLGYRENYIKAIAWDYQENENKYIQLGGDTYDYSMEFLLSKTGIGEKVANCICLYGMHHLEAFPRDIWIKRIEQEHFNGHFPDEQYPDCAGVLQQYMFYYERMKNNDLH